VATPAAAAAAAGDGDACGAIGGIAILGLVGRMSPSWILCWRRRRPADTAVMDSDRDRLMRLTQRCMEPASSLQHQPRQDHSSRLTARGRRDRARMAGHSRPKK